MKCPFCSTNETIVKDSRHNQEHNQIRRRRECLKCKKRYSTIEKIQTKAILVIKRTGLKETFEKDKIFRSISTAMRKRNNDYKIIEDITDNIYASIELGKIREISTIQIGRMIMSFLEKVDEVAYIRFASVYKDFSSVQDFMSFITKMHKKTK